MLNGREGFWRMKPEKVVKMTVKVQKVLILQGVSKDVAEEKSDVIVKKLLKAKRNYIALGLSNEKSTEFVLNDFKMALGQKGKEEVEEEE